MSRLTLRGKFGVLLLAFILAMGSMTVLNFATARRVGADVSLIQRSAYPLLSNAIRAQAQFEVVARLIEDAAATGEPSLLERAHLARGTFTGFMDLLLANAEPASQPGLAQIRSDFAAYYDGAVGLPGLLLTGELLADDTTDDLDRRGQRVFGMRERLEADLGALVAQYDRQLTVRLDQARRRVRRQSAGALAISAVTSIVLLLLLLDVGRRIARPLGSLVAFTAEVGRGNFDRPMDIPGLSDDEIGTLASAFERMTSELRATTVSRSFLDDIISSMADSLIVTGPRGLIETVNDATCAMLGYTADELVGARMRDIVPDADAALAEAAEDASNRGEVRALETTYRTATGGQIPVSLSMSPIRDGTRATQSAVCVAQDITERRNVQRMKDDFIATLSHELRTPLTAIVSSLDLLAMGIDGELPEKARALTAIGQRNGRRLVSLIDEVLDLNRIESGELATDMRSYDVAEIVAEAVETNQAYADQFGVQLILVDERPTLAIFVDRARLMQVMANLLSNAAKFSDEGGKVTVMVASDGDGVRVSVVDEGVGIAPEAQERVFDRFFQVDSSSTRNRGGTGLGLSITKAIVEEFGGTIGVDSSVGSGATFWIQFPKASTPTPD